MTQQADVTKMFKALCSHQSPYKVWADMMVIYSTMISNCVDLLNKDERDRLYSETIRSYGSDEIELLSRLFAEIVKMLDKNPYQDCLGDMYMHLGIGNKNTGQFFTPYHLSKLMAKDVITEELVKKEIETKGYITINEPACGAGANLIAACEVLHDMGINYQTNAFFVAQDVDSTVAQMCYIQISMLGCAGYVRIGDTLGDPITAYVLLGERNSRTWYTPMWYSDHWEAIRAKDIWRKGNEC